MKVGIFIVYLITVYFISDIVSQPEFNGDFVDDIGNIPKHPGREGYASKPSKTDGRRHDYHNTKDMNSLDGDMPRHAQQIEQAQDGRQYNNNQKARENKVGESGMPGRINNIREQDYGRMQEEIGYNPMADMHHMGGMPGGMNNMDGRPGGMNNMGGMPGGMDNMGGMPGGMNNMGGMPGGMNNMGGLHGEMNYMGGMNGGMNRQMNGGMHYQRKGNQMNNINDVQQSKNTTPSTSFMGGALGSLYEIVMFIFIGGFIYNCIFGKTQNDKFSQTWYNANKEYFEKRYEVVGLTNSTNSEENGDIKPTNTGLIKENPYIFKLCCQNYRYIKWLLVILEFRKRADAISMMTSMLVSTKDRIVYEVAINPVEDVAWMFCMGKKSDMAALKKNYPDINFFGKTQDVSILNERLTVTTENLESYMELFQNKNLLGFYKSIEEYIDLIYYTDYNTFCKEKHALFFSFELHLNRNTGHENILLEITHFVNLFADTLAQLKYSDSVKKDFEKNRIMFERSKMEDVMRKEIEEKEKKDFIEQWKLKNKNKNKKPGQKKVKDVKKEK